MLIVLPVWAGFLLLYMVGATFYSLFCSLLQLNTNILYWLLWPAVLPLLLLSLAGGFMAGILKAVFK